METLTQFFRNLLDIVEPLRNMLSLGTFGDAGTAATSTEASSGGEAARTAVAVIIKVLLWGMDLVRMLLERLLGLVS